MTFEQGILQKRSNLRKFSCKIENRVGIIVLRTMPSIFDKNQWINLSKKSLLRKSKYPWKKTPQSFPSRYLRISILLNLKYYTYQNFCYNVHQSWCMQIKSLWFVIKQVIDFQDFFYMKLYVYSFALAIYEKKQLSFQLCYLSFAMGSLTSLSI